MDSQFWISAWNEGRTAFHKADFHEKLTEFFPRLDPAPGQRVLVPLCGKTKDLLWLLSLGLQVHGVELYDQPVEAFFKENGLEAQKSKAPDFVRYSRGDLTLSCGDFLKLNEQDAYDLVYDRAALVALPPEMRKSYAQVIKGALRKGGKCLLISYEYPQAQLEGPPFSVSQAEIRSLYEDQCTIRLLDSKRPDTDGSRLAAVEDLRQTVFVLEKFK